MNRWRKPVLLSIMFCLIGAGQSQAFAGTGTQAAGGRLTSPAVSLSAPSSLTEGDRYRVVAKVAHVGNARRITFQQYLPEYGDYGDPMWKDVRTRSITGDNSLVLKLVADSTSSQRTRAIVQYASGRQITSKAVKVKIWHWIDLTGFAPYYSAGYVFDRGSATFNMNGDVWKGWVTYGQSGAWESRYMPGRNCKAFRGTLGVTDDSSDGVSASFSLFTDETTLVYTSPTLVPGAITPIEIALDGPYRFTIQAHDTTAPDTSHNVYPAIGAPKFLCHFD